jgi:hypothetical protein
MSSNPFDWQPPRIPEWTLERAPKRAPGRAPGQAQGAARPGVRPMPCSGAVPDRPLAPGTGGGPPPQRRMPCLPI